MTKKSKKISKKMEIEISLSEDGLFAFTVDGVPAEPLNPANAKPSHISWLMYCAGFNAYRARAEVLVAEMNEERASDLRAQQVANVVTQEQPAPAPEVPIQTRAKPKMDMAKMKANVPAKEAEPEIKPNKSKPGLKKK